MQERAFCLGLVEECPRCGADGLEFTEGADARRDSVVFESRCKHLQLCTDAASQAAYRSRKDTAQQRETAREEKKLAQEEVQQLAAWEFLGSNQNQLWMLEEGAQRRVNHSYLAFLRIYLLYVIGNLRKRAKNLGIEDVSGSKLDLIEKLAALVLANTFYFF